jgi:ubiquinone/menaquinone biosynthesis C-methylase UbiE
VNVGSSPSVPDLTEQYDKWHEYVSASPDDQDERSPWYQLVLEYLAPVQGKRVLEIACGRGGFSAVLGSRGANVCGADFSAAALKIACQKVGRNSAGFLNIGLLRADAHHLPYADDAFDCVVSCETIEHLTDPPAALQEMARVCKPGGMLYLTTPNYLNLMGLYLVYAAILKKDRRNAATQPLDHRWLFPRVRRMVKHSGWEIVRSDGTVHQVLLPGRNPLRLHFPERNRFSRRLLSPVAFHYFLLARKAGA